MHTFKTGEAWELVGIDLAGPHPKFSRRHVHILTIIDHFTKFDSRPDKRSRGKNVADAVVKSLITTFEIYIDRQSDEF